MERLLICMIVCVVFSIIFIGIFGRYKKNWKVSRGLEMWLDVEMWENLSDCIVILWKWGYCIVVIYIVFNMVSFYELYLLYL